MSAQATRETELPPRLPFVRRAWTRARAEIRLTALAIWRGATGIYHSNDLTFASSIAYYALLSLFPFFLLALAILANVTGNDADREVVIGFVLRYFPRQFEFVNTQLQAMQSAGLRLGVFGSILMVWAAMGVFSTIIFIVLVGLIFYFVPNASVRFRDVWVGAVLTGLLWRVALAGFSRYVRDLHRFSVHGSIAAVVVFLVWVYISAVILLYGVEVTAAYARLRRRRPDEIPAAPAPRTTL